MMKLEHPQEIEVWYIIPAIKRELAKSMLVDYGLNQKQIAGMLGITESAVSQYLNSKRAMDVEFTNEFRDMIKQSAKGAIESKASMVREIQRICSEIRKSKFICEIHKKHGIVYQETCQACEGLY